MQMILSHSGDPILKSKLEPCRHCTGLVCQSHSGVSRVTSGGRCLFCLKPEGGRELECAGLLLHWKDGEAQSDPATLAGQQAPGTLYLPSTDSAAPVFFSWVLRIKARSPYLYGIHLSAEPSSNTRLFMFICISRSTISNPRLRSISHKICSIELRAGIAAQDGAMDAPSYGLCPKPDSSGPFPNDKDNFSLLSTIIPFYCEPSSTPMATMITLSIAP